jgi:hypothetical protein
VMQTAEQLGYLGLRNLGRVYWNLPTPALYEEAIRRYEGMLGHLGRWWCVRVSTPDDCLRTNSSSGNHEHAPEAPAPIRSAGLKLAA